MYICIIYSTIRYLLYYIISLSLPDAPLGHSAKVEASHPAYPVDSSEPSSQSEAQSHAKAESIQDTVPDSHVNQPPGHSCLYQKINTNAV